MFPRRLVTRRFIGWVVLPLFLITCLGLAVRFVPGTDFGRGLIEGGLNGMKFGQLGHLRVQGLAGDPWDAISIRRLSLADKAGEWVLARNVTLNLRASDLLHRQVHMTQLNIRSITVLRRPTLGPQDNGPVHPLPLGVKIDHLRARAVFEPAFAEQRGVYELSGIIDIQRSEKTDIFLAVTSILYPGDYLRLRFDRENKTVFTAEVSALEAQGGALAGSFGLATHQPFMLKMHASGQGNHGDFLLHTQVGVDEPFAATGRWSPQGIEASGQAQLTASSLLTDQAKLFGPQASFRISGGETSGSLIPMTLEVTSQNLKLHAQGSIDLDQQAVGPRGVVADLRVTDPTSMLGIGKFGSAHLAAKLTGNLNTWLVAGSLEAQTLTVRDYTLARAMGPVRLEGKSGAWRAKLEIAGKGGAGNGILFAWLGTAPSAALDMTQLADGRLLISKMSLVGDGITVKGTGDRGLFGELSFKGEARATRFEMAHAGGHGAAFATWAARQPAAGHPWQLGFDATGDKFSTGYHDLDHLLGPSAHARAEGTWDDDVLSLSRMTLEGSGANASGAGLVGPAGGLKLHVDWHARGPIGLGPLQIDGAASGTGQIGGNFDHPTAALQAQLPHLDLPQLPVSAVRLNLDVAWDVSGASGRISATGASDFGPAHAMADFRTMSDTFALSHIDMVSGGVSAQGSATLAGNQATLADLQFSVEPGAWLSAGRATGRVSIFDGHGETQASLKAQARGAILRQGGMRVATLDLTADGPLAHLNYKLSAAGQAAGNPWRITGMGQLQNTAAQTSVVFTGSGRLRQSNLRTLEPARLTLSGPQRGGRLRLGVGTGTADIDLAFAAGALRAAVKVAGVDLALFDSALVGKVEGSGSLSGNGEALSGDLQAHLTHAGAKDAAEPPTLGGSVVARLRPGTLSLDANLTDAQGLRAQTSIILPAEASASPLRIAINTRRPIRGNFAIDGQIKPLWDTVFSGAGSLAGRVDASGKITGTLADPSFIGTAALTQGRYRDSGAGVTLQGLTSHAVVSENAVDVADFAATDGARGSVTGSGRLSLLRNDASSFRLNFKMFRLFENDIGQALASGGVTVSRAGDGHVKLTGALNIDHALIAAKAPIASGVVPMEVVEINRPVDEAQIVAVAANHQPPMALDVTLKAPGGIFVKGRGLNVELSLEAQVGGTLAQPSLSGLARVVRGDYNFAGQRFQIDDRGTIRLGTTAETIRLNLTATRENPTLTAVIQIQGTAAKPIIILTSTPVLPKDEVLSQVLFGASAAQLSPYQAAQLASAVSGLAGGGGLDLIGGLRNFAHLDRLALGSGTTTPTTPGGVGTSTGPTIAGGKYLTDKVYLELTGGSREGPGAQVEWRIGKHISVVSHVTSQGEQQISVRWRQDK